MDIKDPSKEYQITHPAGPVFTLKHWTLAMQEMVDRECLEIDDKDGARWNLTRERMIKLEQCLVGWEGLTFEGELFLFSPENRKMLPVGIIIWIVKDIDEKAGVRLAEAEKKS